jgi:hypothetical protein
MVTLAATSPRAATAMADWNQGRLPSGPGRRLALGGSRIPAGPPRGLAFMGATGGWGASAVLPDPADICPPMRMLGHKSMLGQK